MHADRSGWQHGDYAMTEPITIAVKDAQQALGVGRTTIFSLLAEGRLQRLKIGRRTVIPTESLRAFVAELAAGAEVQP
jgi:excisionase family DNA binding protein